MAFLIILNVLSVSFALLALVIMIMTMFSSVGQRPQRLFLSHPTSIDYEDFAQSISRACNAHVGSQNEKPHLYNNGDQYFTKLLEDISAATQSINFMVYICEPGNITDEFFAALIAKAHAGIEVRVMFDGIGAINAPGELVNALQDAGGKVNNYRPIRFGKLTRFYQRNHRRAIVIDGEIGWIGGAALADHWTGDAQDSDHWRDSMVRLIGPMVLSVQSAFAQIWSDNVGEILVGDKFYPQKKKKLALTNPKVKYISVVSSPTHEMHPLSRFYWFSFAAAKKSIYITNSYFVPIEDIREMLAEKAQSGVDVKILLPGPDTDVPFVRFAAQRLYYYLLTHGVKIYEYQGTMMHAKHAVIDSEWSIVGSANLDMRSLHLNKENVFGVLSPSFAKDLERTFFDDLKKAEEITLAEWKKRPIFNRVIEQAMYLFEEQF